MTPLLAPDSVITTELTGGLVISYLTLLRAGPSANDVGSFNPFMVNVDELLTNESDLLLEGPLRIFLPRTRDISH